MALKEYKLIRPTDEAEFTMMLDDDDKAKYEKADWKVTETRRKNPITPKDLAAAKTTRRSTTAKDADTDGDDVTVTE